MDALEAIVTRARDGEAEAFGILVRRFQDMAVGYGYSVLHDFQLAEDAAQEAFFEAYRTLSKLREPAAFAGWFRRIVFKQCDRITRRRVVATVPLEAAPDPLQATGEEERKGEVLEAVRQLPEHERSVMTLFYIGGYSMDEVATFLEVPVSTVKGRLHSARERIRTMLLDTVADDLRARRPSRNQSFETRVVDLLEAARGGDIERVKTLLKADRRLLVGRDPMGNTALIIAVNTGHEALADLLFDAGVEPGLHEAAAIGDSSRVRAALDRDPALLDTDSPEGFTPLALAAHFGHLDVMRLLIDRGADVNRVATHRLAVTPLHAALFGRQVGAALLLIERGADVTLARGGSGWKRAGWTPLHYAASMGFSTLVQPLLDRGADRSRADEDGKTPLDVAIDANHTGIVDVLRSRGVK
ncbi:MAG TPA: sigma-70 family RNA polymerase sigma factor [Vicinamibacterales bacterium]|nr:sigma-70 family RNA polymerase sigma factor [Vicinamibacterales bacterium]